MNLEGRKFHFARDDEGHIYAENEIETETANRDGWLLPPRKGEIRSELYNSINGSKGIEIISESTGELEDDHPVYKISNVKEIRPSGFASQQLAEGREWCSDENDKGIINYFAMLLRSYHISGGSCLAYKVLTAVCTYANSGRCANTEEDSVCGGVCATCRDA